MNGWVRLTAFGTPDVIKNIENSSSNWTSGDDGFYYYDGIVESGATTEPLILKFNTTNINKPNIIAISEMIGSMYDGLGEPYADWERQIEIIE